MIRDWLSGRIRLVITYWIFGVLVALIYRAIGIGIENYYIQIIQTPYMIWLIRLFILFPFLYFPLNYIAIWRSSNNYTKNKLWPILAKIAVCLGAVFLVISAILTVKQLVNRDQPSEVINAVAFIKKSLPVKFDNVLFTNISFSNNIITYDYQLNDKEKSQLETTMLGKEMKPKLINFLCSNKQMQIFMSQGISISSHFYDKNNVLIYEYTVKQADCP